jgi:hypothetical protein
MAVFKNFKDDELIISCKCGCDEGIHFAICDYKDGDYAFVTHTSGNYYREQCPFREKLKKIWAIIRNKDYYYSEVCMDKNDFEQFAEWINKKNTKQCTADEVINILDKIAKINPNIEITIDGGGENCASVKLSEALIYESGYGNLVIDAEK